MAQETGKKQSVGKLVLTLPELNELLKNNPKCEIHITKSKDGKKEYYSFTVNGNHIDIEIGFETGYLTQYEKSESKPSLNINLSKELSEADLSTILNFNRLKLNTISKFMKTRDEYSKYTVFPMIKTHSTVPGEDSEGNYVQERVFYLSSQIVLQSDQKPPTFCTSFYDITISEKIEELKEKNSAISENLKSELSAAMDNPIILKISQ